MSDKWATDSEQTIGELQVLLAQKDVEIERLRLKLHDEEMAFAMQTGVKEAAEAKLAEAQAALHNDPRHWRFDWWRKAIAAEAKLTAWQAAESLPDCPACAVLDSQDGGKS